jgi:hypothetical protein
MCKYLLLANLGEVAQKQGHLSTSRGILPGRSCTLSSSVSGTPCSGCCKILLTNLGAIATEQENYAQAEVYLHEVSILPSDRQTRKRPLTPSARNRENCLSSYNWPSGRGAVISLRGQTNMYQKGNRTQPHR